VVVPEGATRPTPGAMLRSVASVDDQVSVTASPGLIEVVEALSVTVGCAGAGAGVGAGGAAPTCFLHPPTSRANPARQHTIATCRKDRSLINNPPAAQRLLSAITQNSRRKFVLRLGPQNLLKL
jgi:hypothetical protein